MHKILFLEQAEDYKKAYRAINWDSEQIEAIVVDTISAASRVIANDDIDVFVISDYKNYDMSILGPISEAFSKPDRIQLIITGTYSDLKDVSKFSEKDILRLNVIKKQRDLGDLKTEIEKAIQLKMIVSGYDVLKKENQILKSEALKDKEKILCLLRSNKDLLNLLSSELSV